MTRWLHQPGKGFSLIELTVAIVVIALAAPPLTALIYNVMTQGTQTDKRTAASALAKGLMEEILSNPFEDPQLAPGSFGTEEGTRADYDDIDDYDGLSQSPPADSLGSPLTQFSAFRSQALVENVNPEDVNGPAAADGSTNFKRVTATVSWDSAAGLVRLVGLASNFSQASAPQPGLTFLNRVNCSAENLEFRVRNDTGQAIYLSHVTAAWTAPTAYYEQITVNAEGYQNYAVVWDYAQRNSVRNESSSAAMFNQGLIVLIPAGTVMDIKIHNFYNNRKGSASAMNVKNTPFSVELWAAPDRYLPITIPPLP